MIVEIISTGTELLLGEIINTNSTYLAGKLNAGGFDVLYQSTVGDNRLRMLEVIKTALQRADIVITTGGLGPTLGDITKEVSATLLKRELKLHQPSLDRIKYFFATRNITMSDNNLRQAMIPEQSIVLNNYCGTAPGVILETDGKCIIHLPGPPFEVIDMFERSVLPYLQTTYGIQGIIHSKILRTVGIGESILEENIRELILNQSNPTLALLARQGEVIIRITAKANNQAEALDKINEIEGKIRAKVDQYIYGTDQDTLTSVVGNLLTTTDITIACAESCTGGLLSSLLTDIPGSSDYFLGTIVAYNNAIKNRLLNVSENSLLQYGAVSEQVAKEMAQGVREKFSTKIGLSITGIAGPGGATPTKPVGLVYIGFSTVAGATAYEYRFTGSRQNIKNRATVTALNHIRQYLL